MSHFVYILKSLKDGKHYIGSSADVQKRVEYHNKGKQRSTRNRVPFELIYFEEYTTKTEAESREREISRTKGAIHLRNYWRV